MSKVRSVHYLRGIAVLLVMSIHWIGAYKGGETLKHILRLNFMPHTSESSYISQIYGVWTNIASNVWLLNFNFAGLGVLLFFLISGFVITISIENQNVLEFGIKRFFRLFPVLWFYIIICMLFQKLLTIIGYPSGGGITLTQVIANATLISDWLWLPYFDMSLWTLHVEIKFYVMMALLSVMVTRVSWQSIFALAMLISLIALPVSALGTPNDLEVLYNNDSNFGWQRLFFIFSVIGNNARFLVFMLIGSIIYLWYANRVSTGKTLILVFILLMLCIVLQTVAPNGLAQGHYFPDYFRSVIIFFSMIFLEKKYGSRVKVPKIITRPMSYIGDTSYIIYLFHGLFGMTLISVIHTHTSNINLALLLTFITLVPIIWFTHRYVEHPSIRLGKKLANFVVELSKQHQETVGNR